MSNESAPREYYIGEPYRQIIVNLLDEVGILKPGQHLLYAAGNEPPQLEGVYIIRNDGTKTHIRKPGELVEVHPGDILCNGDERVLLT